MLPRGDGRARGVTDQRALLSGAHPHLQVDPACAVRDHESQRGLRGIERVEQHGLARVADVCLDLRQHRRGLEPECTPGRRPERGRRLGRPVAQSLSPPGERVHGLLPVPWHEHHDVLGCRELPAGVVRQHHPVPGTEGIGHGGQKSVERALSSGERKEHQTRLAMEGK